MIGRGGRGLSGGREQCWSIAKDVLILPISVTPFDGRGKSGVGAGSWEENWHCVMERAFFKEGFHWIYRSLSVGLYDNLRIADSRQG